MKRYALSLHILFLFLTVISAHAAELKLIDELGLIRGITQIEEPAQVMIRPSTSHAGEVPMLKQIDGLKADIVGTPKEDGFLFLGVAAGTWRISFKPLESETSPQRSDGKNAFTSERARDYTVQFSHSAGDPHNAGS